MRLEIIIITIPVVLMLMLVMMIGGDACGCECYDGDNADAASGLGLHHRIGDATHTVQTHRASFGKAHPCVHPGREMPGGCNLVRCFRPLIEPKTTQYFARLGRRSFRKLPAPSCPLLDRPRSRVRLGFQSS